jgi:large subunit ribosomal protein L22
MDVKAVAKYITISPRKVRRAMAGLRGLQVEEAQARLRASPDHASRAISKVLKSAVANAENNHELDADDLVVRRAYADRAPISKRVTPRARGRADVVTKRSSHITVVVGERTAR